MLGQIRRLLTPETKKIILKSIPFRLYDRHEAMSTFRFSVELTTKCNLNCYMCTRMPLIKNHKLRVTDMKPEIIDRIIEEIKIFIKNGYRVEFTPMGLGEPFLAPNLFPIIKKIRKISSQIKIIIVTNGLLMHKKAISNLIKYQVDEVCVSLNAANESEYQHFMKGGNYQKVRNNIINLITAKNLSNNKRPAVFVQLLDYKNKPEKIAQEMAYWNKLAKYNDKVFIHPIANQAGNNKRIVSTIKKEMVPCISPLIRVAIKINGDIYPCDPCFYSGNEPMKELFLGNIKNVSPYDLIKNKKSKVYEIIEMFKQDDYRTLPHCQKCDSYKFNLNSFIAIPKILRVGKNKWL
jgi:radical SAM protein with 4Fe4S-binding SPASM domain